MEVNTTKIDINYHVIDRCNKNCIACGHFAPLADPSDEGVSIEQFTNDMKSLYNIRECIHKIIITGGEPTLHKNIIDLLKIAKQYFDNVQFCSNGLDINFFSKNSNFFIENNIEIFVTRYGDAIEQIIGFFPPSFTVYSYDIPSLENDEGKREKFYSQILTSKNINLKKSLKCNKNCLQFYNNKLYLCQYTANLHLLKKYFNNIKFPFDENNTFIDIKEKTAAEVVNFINNSWPEICYHCKQPYLDKNIDLVKTVNLTLSKKELSEFYEE